MFKASAFFTQLGPSSRKRLLKLLRQSKEEMKYMTDFETHENLGDLILQLEHDHDDQTRIERAERECQASKSP